MGRLVSGTWFDDDPLPADHGGAFLRPDSSFRDGAVPLLESDLPKGRGLGLFARSPRPTG